MYTDILIPYEMNSWGLKGKKKAGGKIKLKKMKEMLYLDKRKTWNKALLKIIRRG